MDYNMMIMNNSGWYNTKIDNMNENKHIHHNNHGFYEPFYDFYGFSMDFLWLFDNIDGFYGFL